MRHTTRILERSTLAAAALVAASVVVAGVALAGAPSAGASATTPVPACPQAGFGSPQSTSVGQSVTVVAHLCLPTGDTLANVSFSWGDGTTSAATVAYGSPVAPGQTGAALSGTHAYAHAGGYPLAVTWTDGQTGLSSSYVSFGVGVSVSTQGQPQGSSVQGAGPPAGGTGAPAPAPTPAPRRYPLSGAGVAVRDVGRELAVSVAGMPSGAELRVRTFRGPTRAGAYVAFASMTTSYSSARVAARRVTRVILQLLDPSDPRRDSGTLTYLL